MQNNFLKINTILLVLIGIVVVVIGVVMLNKQRVFHKKLDQVSNTTKQDTYPSFVQAMIDADAMIDRIYKYTYQGDIYYYLSGWEKVDGTPRVFAESGTEIQCNFPSPMIPVNQIDPNAKSVSPVCQGYASGSLIYERK